MLQHKNARGCLFLLCCLAANLQLWLGDGLVGGHWTSTELWIRLGPYQLHRSCDSLDPCHLIQFPESFSPGISCSHSFHLLARIFFFPFAFLRVAKRSPKVLSTLALQSAARLPTWYWAKLQLGFEFKWSTMSFIRASSGSFGSELLTSAEGRRPGGGQGLSTDLWGGIVGLWSTSFLLRFFFCVAVSAISASSLPSCNRKANMAYRSCLEVASSWDRWYSSISSALTLITHSSSCWSMTMSSERSTRPNSFCRRWQAT